MFTVFPIVGAMSKPRRPRRPSLPSGKNFRNSTGSNTTISWFHSASTFAGRFHRCAADVPDPTTPQLVTYIPGPENTWTIQIQVAEGKMITALERIAPGWGGVDGQAFAEGFFIFDVSEPTKPRRIGHFQTGSTGTHRNF